MLKKHVVKWKLTGGLTWATSRVCSVNGHTLCFVPPPHDPLKAQGHRIPGIAERFQVEDTMIHLPLLS